MCFACRLRFRLPLHCFYKAIDAFIGYLYAQPRYRFPPPLRKALKQRNLQTVKITLDFLNCWPTWPFENPERDEEDKCAVW
jgi:hypothetical protein